MGDNAAQCTDGRLQLLQRRRILFGDDQVDLLRQRLHGIVETDQLLGRRQIAQGVADFLQAALDSGQYTKINARCAGLIEPLRQRLHLGFERFHGAARQRFRELVTDFRKVLAERCDDAFKLARWPQRFYPRRDEAQLLFDIADVDGRLRRRLLRTGRQRRRRRRHRWRFR